ncbi:26S proteasome regulatory subunit RPN5 [Theobroma cacao]|nr:26S proteasome regulatory subunit RPN5 [Theobroma cacao]
MGIVCFQVAKDSNEILNSWSVNLEKLLDLVEKSCHQIHKETMVHKAALKVAKDSNEILNSWSVNLEKLLDLVEKSCHQIHKETMVHKAALKV